MEQAIVSFVVERLGNLLIEEASCLYGVRSKVEKIQRELKLMLSFLKDADARQDQDQTIRDWVSEIRELAYDIEDLINTFAMEAELGKRNLGRKYNPIKKLFTVFSKFTKRYKVSSDINDATTRISDLTASLRNYNVESFAGKREREESSVNNRRRLNRTDYPHVIDDDTVGLDESTRNLVNQLVKSEGRSSVVSIWGMGGVGKTTQAKKVYHHGDIQRHFNCFAWASISKQFNVRAVLRGILIKLTSPSRGKRRDIEKWDEEELLKNVYQVQMEEKCLVVLDDLWEIRDWDGLKQGFPLHRSSSKLIVTTRNKAVALRVDPLGFLFEPKLFSEEESWELLRRKAFRTTAGGGGDSGDVGIDKGMEKLGKEMVKDCRGLPYAIVVLGGILATKSTIHEWKAVHKNIKSCLRNGNDTEREGEGVSDVLALSYQDLSYHLKPCFLYLAHFPEDSEIPTKTLIRMWVAEGLISGTREERLEEVAQGYLDELIERCMIQVEARSSNGRVKTYSLHDLMRDLCLSKAKEENFVEIINLQQVGRMEPTIASNKVRRRAVYLDQGDHIWSFEDARRRLECANHDSFDLKLENAAHIRSLLVFSSGRVAIHQTLRQLDLKNYKLLRVLKLEELLLEEKLLRAIGNLFHLKFLSFRNSWLLCFPSAVGNLWGIETLDFRFRTYDEVTCSEIHNVISKMKWLRHFYLPARIKKDNSKVQWEMANLNLETLKNYDASLWPVQHLEPLLKLQKLEMINLKSFQELGVILKPPCSISNCLQSLILKNVGARTEEHDLARLSACEHLYKLYLPGEVSKLPRHDNFPQNLSKLTLRESRLEEDPIPILEMLPHLMVLYLLDDACLMEEMVFSTNRFPKLKYLNLSRIHSLKRFRVDENAMPTLNRLDIAACSSLEMIPEGLRYVTTLQVLGIQFMPKQFNKRLQVINGIEGEDFYKVQHVPSISFWLIAQFETPTIH